MEAGESLQRKFYQELLGACPSTPFHPTLNVIILSPRHCFDARSRHHFRDFLLFVFYSVQSGFMISDIND